MGRQRQQRDAAEPVHAATEPQQQKNAVNDRPQRVPVQRLAQVSVADADKQTEGRWAIWPVEGAGRGSSTLAPKIPDSSRNVAPASAFWAASGFIRGGGETAAFGDWHRIKDERV